MTGRTELIEASPVPRAFCTELARIERIGPCSMLVFAMEQAALYGSADAKERIIEARVIVPTETLPAIAAMIARACERGEVQQSLLAMFEPQEGKMH